MQIKKFIYRIANWSDADEQSVGLEALGKGGTTPSDGDDDETSKVDPLPSKLVGKDITEAFPQHATNTEHHHGNFRKDAPLTDQLPLGW